MPKVAEHMQPKRAAKRPKGSPKRRKEASNGSQIRPKWLPGNLQVEGFNLKVETCPKNGSSGGQGGAKLAPKTPKTACQGTPKTVGRFKGTFSVAQEVHNPAIGPNQGGQNEQDRSSCIPARGVQGAQEVPQIAPATFAPPTPCVGQMWRCFQSTQKDTKSVAQGGSKEPCGEQGGQYEQDRGPFPKLLMSKSLGPLPQGGQYEQDRTLKRSQRKSARRKACRRVRDEVPQCPPPRLLHPAREAGAPVHGTGIALHGDKSVRDREVKSPRDGDQAFIKEQQTLGSSTAPAGSKLAEA